MTVYAQYFEKNGLSFRINTLLQFGESWELIGNVVLANPRSASPIGIADASSITNLRNFYDLYRGRCVFVEENWYLFSPDPTMRRVEKIFNGGYVKNEKELQGVIQLFNVFNVRNQNLAESLILDREQSEYMFSNGIERYFHDKPTYFGFSQEVLQDELLKEVAKNIFEHASPNIKTIYEENFDDNKFYHPTYINRAINQEHFAWYKTKVLERLPIQNQDGYISPQIYQ